jgi:mRNA interferase RelE/StbE
MYNIIVSKKAEKVLDKLPNEYYELISKHLLILEENPPPYGSIKLTGSKNTYRIRVGVYRTIYTIEDEILTVEVIKIDQRKSVYK